MKTINVPTLTFWEARDQEKRNKEIIKEINEHDQKKPEWQEELKKQREQFNQIFK